MTVPPTCRAGRWTGHRLRVRGRRGSSRCLAAVSVCPEGSKIFTQSTVENCRSVGKISPAIVAGASTPCCHNRR